MGQSCDHLPRDKAVIQFSAVLAREVVAHEDHCDPATERHPLPERKSAYGVTRPRTRGPVDENTQIEIAVSVHRKCALSKLKSGSRPGTICLRRCADLPQAGGYRRNSRLTSFCRAMSQLI